jgi:lipopolysaccharide transport system permease protein
MYPMSSVPEKWQLVYGLNPMVGIIEGFRSVVVKGTAPDISLLLVSLLGTALIWAIAWPLFRYLSNYFADAL